MKDLAHAEGVDLRFFGERIGDRRHINSEGKKIFVLHDLYSRADLVMYPSIYEGFGNALLESFYFKVPIVVNRYPVWVRDIEPKGFQVPMMNGFVDRKTVIEARRLLEDQKYREKMVEGNFKLASKYYGYPVLRYCLQVLINNIKYAT
jgi:glycosyltransferase involved in cell wall biosynthesis